MVKWGQSYISARSITQIVIFEKRPIYGWALTNERLVVKNDIGPDRNKFKETSYDMEIVQKISQLSNF